MLVSPFSHILLATLMLILFSSFVRTESLETSKHFLVFWQILAKHARPISGDSQGGALVPAAKEEEIPLSDWELVRGYFGKLHVLLASLSLTIVLLHIWFAPPKLRATLIRWGFDLPDTISELLFSAIVVLQVENVVKMMQQFLQARYWQCKFTAALTHCENNLKDIHTRFLVQVIGLMRMFSAMT